MGIAHPIHQLASIDIFNPVYGACGMWVIPVSLNNATHGVGANGRSPLEGIHL